MDGSRITSRQNRRVKEALELRQRRYRDARHQFLIDGAREINRALDAGIGIRAAFVCDELCRSDSAKLAAERLATTSAEVLPVSPEVFSKLAFGERDEGLVAVADTPSCLLEDVNLAATPLVAVIESIEKPGNLGAILRSADATGIDAVLVTGQGTDLYNPNTIRASLGTAFRQNLCVVAPEEIIAWLREHQIAVFAARPDATQTAYEVDLTGAAAMVLGSEAEGLSELWTAAGAIPIRLPMRGVADSLNVSATAAALFYEALRQRTTRQ